MSSLPAVAGLDGFYCCFPGLLAAAGWFFAAEDVPPPFGVSWGLLNRNISSNSRLGLTTSLVSFGSLEDYLGSSVGFANFSVDCLPAGRA